VLHERGNSGICGGGVGAATGFTPACSASKPDAENGGARMSVDTDGDVGVAVWSSASYLRGDS
jgi:hypothetical protein